MTLQDKLKKLREERKAILAANFYNLETLQAALRAASHEGVPIILQLSESSIRYIGLELAAKMARAAIEAWKVEAWLHLDHGGSLELVRRCLDAGFDSVMIDASEKALEENIRISREAVKMAAKYGANVEAELGYIAKLHQKQSVESGFTRPDDALRFAEETGVSALAVSIGTAHGFYREEPKLDIELLGRIREKVETPLVLHGSSGVPDEAILAAIRNGITKINLATEIKNAFMKKLKSGLMATDEIDLRIVFPKATDAACELIQNKLRLITHA
ncbi:MAG: ketose-bisphosphate aldolase [Bacteroidetes bacterium]|nr:MAG: ketose-bisphosphate aldolase [Bacteroidota bacterium]